MKVRMAFLIRAFASSHNRIPAGVDTEFKPRCNHVESDLTPRKLRRGDDVGLLNIQRVVARIPLVSSIRGIVERLGNGQTTIFTASLTLVRQTAIECVVIRDVILHVLGMVPPVVETSSVKAELGEAISLTFSVTRELQ